MKTVSSISSVIGIILAVLVCSMGCYHGCKYHPNDVNNDSYWHMAYYGIEQFWHKDLNEYKFTYKTILDLQKDPLPKVDEYLKGKHFTEKIDKRLEDGSDVSYWNYCQKINDKDIPIAHLEYYNSENHIGLVYRFADENYYLNTLADFAGAGFEKIKSINKDGRFTAILENKKSNLSMFVITQLEPNSGLTMYSFSISDLDYVKKKMNEIDSTTFNPL